MIGVGQGRIRCEHINPITEKLTQSIFDPLRPFRTNFCKANVFLIDLSVIKESTSLAQWFNKYHAGLEVMSSIPMGDFHI